MDISLYSKSFESITGIKLSQKEMLQAGKRIHILERYLNTLDGISKADDKLPKRLLKEGRKSDPKEEVVPLDKLLKAYYKIKEYDSNGIPKPALLKKLGISISSK
jgi:aldehyde:ferredoxin oxidoreductase